VNCGGFEQRKLSYPGPGVIRYSSSTKIGFTPIKRQQRGFYPYRLKRIKRPMVLEKHPELSDMALYLCQLREAWKVGGGGDVGFCWGGIKLCM
jgi:hypothetical protein